MLATWMFVLPLTTWAFSARVGISIFPSMAPNPLPNGLSFFGMMFIFIFLGLAALALG
jgi:hypothetical protein